MYDGKIPDNVQARGCHSEPQIRVLQSLPPQTAAPPQKILNANSQAMIIGILCYMSYLSRKSLQEIR